MKWEDVVKGIVRNAGASGVKELEDALSRIKEEVDEPWKKAILSMCGDAVEKFGPVGLAHVDGILEDILAGNEPDIEFASLKARSNYLAVLQNMEADKRNKARDLLRVVGKKLGEILKAILIGLAG